MEELPPTTELEEGLRNGVYLAKLARFFAPKLVSDKKIYDVEQTRYKASRAPATWLPPCGRAVGGEGSLLPSHVSLQARSVWVGLPRWLQPWPGLASWSVLRGSVCCGERSGFPPGCVPVVPTGLTFMHAPG